jgi:hypothetical protein
MHHKLVVLAGGREGATDRQSPTPHGELRPQQCRATQDRRTALRAFTTVPQLFSGRGAPPAQAAAWTADANRIRSVLGC